MTEPKGLLIIYTGPGKGKTTCALGTAFRAPESAAPTTMGDEDFMAALSRAFAESEQQRQSPGDEGEPEAGDVDAQKAPETSEEES